MKYKVPMQVDDYIIDNGFISYSGSELSIDMVDCSNKLIPVYFEHKYEVYIDLENGNVVSAYRPGGVAFLLGNLIRLYNDYNYNLELSNMWFWLEAYSMSEVSLDEAGAGMAENPLVSSVMALVLLKHNIDMGPVLRKYLMDCSDDILVLKDVFGGRKSRLKEQNALPQASYVKDHNTVLSKIMMYLRARNKDIQAFYCRDNDSFYVQLANSLNIGKFLNKDGIVRQLRSLSHMKNSDLVSVLKTRDESVIAEFHDFALDLEKLNVIYKKL